jgi:hypothetical protein
VHGKNIAATRLACVTVVGVLASVRIKVIPSTRSTDVGPLELRAIVVAFELRLFELGAFNGTHRL